MIDFRSIAAVVCCQPGGAEIVSAFVKEAELSPLRCLEGPACSIFERKLSRADNHPVSVIENLDPRAQSVLTGTSYLPNLERDAIALCRRRGIACAAYLDHWVNYPLRFGAQDWKSKLPDEVWVGDDEALELALKEGFPPEKLRLVPNPHFAEIRRIINGYRPFTSSGRKKRLLLLCEPVSEDAAAKYGDKEAFGFTEFTIAADLLEAVPALADIVGEVRIRPHPIERPGKYDHLISGYRGPLVLSQSAEKDFLKEILWADAVVAVESMGLVFALWAGKGAFSYIPSKKYKCHLPHQGIRHIRSIEQIGRDIPI